MLCTQRTTETYDILLYPFNMVNYSTSVGTFWLNSCPKSFLLQRKRIKKEIKKQMEVKNNCLPPLAACQVWHNYINNPVYIVERAQYGLCPPHRQLSKVLYK